MRLEFRYSFVREDDRKWHDDKEEVFLKRDVKRSGDAQHLGVVEIPMLGSDGKPVPNEEEDGYWDDRRQSETNSPQDSDAKCPFQPPRSSGSEEEHYEVPVTIHALIVSWQSTTYMGDT